ncbi:chordin-like protein 2 [Ciconia boyciana]|uniref:chordin-like protein 2 n=1 Tax=Ciconia boyciana TaxID=52775 RepID=UPI003B9F8CA1
MAAFSQRAGYGNPDCSYASVQGLPQPWFCSDAPGCCPSTLCALQPSWFISFPQDTPSYQEEPLIGARRAPPGTGTAAPPGTGTSASRTPAPPGIAPAPRHPRAPTLAPRHCTPGRRPQHCWAPAARAKLPGTGTETSPGTAPGHRAAAPPGTGTKTPPGTGTAAPPWHPRAAMLPGAGPLAFLLRCLLLLFASESRARARPDVFCDFNGKKYSPGESWHPYLEPQGLMYCIRCSCSENANIRCYRIQCPALQCASPVTDPQQCCPRCLEPHSPSGLRAPVKSCQYNGTTYQQGEMFTTSELFPSRQPNQCVQCSCSEGQIYCGLVTCPELLCSSPLTVPESCCQVCKDGSYEKSTEDEHLQLNRGVRHSQDQCLGEAVGRKPPGATASTVLSSSLEFIPRSFKPKGGGGTTVKIVLKEKHKKACVYNGKTYSHGEVWHPVFRLYGLLPCILCTCRDGVQDCQKITCPKEYPCDYPEKVDGKCCKICPETRVKPTDETVTARCGKNPNRVLVYMFVPPSSETSKEILRTIAIEKEPAEEVEIYNWKLIKGIFHLIQTKKISKQEFKQEAQNFRLITRTNEGHWNIFRAQTSELRMTESPEKETKNL